MTALATIRGWVKEDSWRSLPRDTINNEDGFMCTASMVYDYGRQSPPWQTNPIPMPGLSMQQQFISPTPLPDTEARDAIKQFIKLLDNAKEYDRATKQPDCEDPAKAEFMKQILDRLDAIERRLGSVKPREGDGR